LTVLCDLDGTVQNRHYDVRCFWVNGKSDVSPLFYLPPEILG
jgi:hypothetical protein